MLRLEVVMSSIYFNSAIALEDMDNLSLCICKPVDGELTIRKIKNHQDLPWKYKCNFSLGERLALIDNVNCCSCGCSNLSVKKGDVCRIAFISIISETT